MKYIKNNLSKIVPVLIIGLAIGTFFGGTIKNTYATWVSRVQLSDGVESGVANIDGFTEALVSIDQAHHEIHEGDHYYVEGWIELDTGEDHKVVLETPDNGELLHFVWIIESSGILTTELWEGITGGVAGGASTTPLNNYRNLGNGSDIIISSGVGFPSASGTRISNKKVGGLGYKSVFGGTASRDDELILKTNTDYMRVFNSGSDDNIISFKASWYEESPKN